MRLHGLLFFASALTAVPAGAATYCGPEVSQDAYGSPAFWAEKMTFRVMDNGGERIFLAEGGYDAEAGDRFEAELKAAGEIDEVWLSSPGGDVDAGLKMGRVLKSRGVAVRVPTKHACISSCTLAFLGGAIRVVDPNAYYGIHMFTRYSKEATAGSDINDAMALLAAARKKSGKNIPVEVAYAYALQEVEERSAKQAAELARYLVEMSASLNFLTGMAGQPNNGVCYVTREGLTRYNVVNTD